MNQKIVFFGSSEFSAIILEKLISYGFIPGLIVTISEKPSGRKLKINPSVVRILAEKAGIPVFDGEGLEKELKSFQPSVGIVASYGKILPESILSIPEFGFLNVHPSLLPHLRGSSPLQTTILNGDDKTGVSIILMDEKMDHGPILETKIIDLKGRPSLLELQTETAGKGAEMLARIIPLWLNQKITPVPQDDTKATFCKPFKKEDGRINWQLPAYQIERQVRALNPWPGTFSFFSKNNRLQSIKILQASVLEQTSVGPFGKPGKTFLASNEKIAVQCQEDFLIIEKLQLESGKPLLVRDFLRGHIDFIGVILE